MRFDIVPRFELLRKFLCASVLAGQRQRLRARVRCRIGAVVAIQRACQSNGGGLMVGGRGFSALFADSRLTLCHVLASENQMIVTRERTS